MQNKRKKNKKLNVGTSLIPIKKEESSMLSPFHEMDRLRERMNNFFDFSLSRFFDDFGKIDLFQRAWGPPVDIFESNDEIHIKVDLPGINKNDIDISILGNRLFIKGEKKLEKKEEKKGHLRAERFYGSFQRMIDIPQGVKESEVKGTYKDGVLEITLPKKDGLKPKQIKIE